MKIIIIGSGISGLSAAFYLEQQKEKLRALKHEDTINIKIIEANNRLGGHTDTHSIQTSNDDKAFSVDTGFIVFNPLHYPNFTQILDTLHVEYQPSDMSFSVNIPNIDLEYGTEGFGALFCQKKRLLDLRFWQMLRDINKFYLKAKTFLNETDSKDLPIGAFLNERNISEAFKHYHLYPMISALWSCPEQRIDDLSTRHILSFFKNHNMLQILNRPTWYTIKNGGRTYVEAIKNYISADIHLSEPVLSVKRTTGKSEITTTKAKYNCDHLIFATHTDQALKILDKPSESETAFLSNIPYEPNRVVLHSDERLMPKSRKAWSSWNVNWEQTQQPNLHPQSRCSVTYYMNKLQSLKASEPFLVSLNPVHSIRNEKYWLERNYSHPIFNENPNQKRKVIESINGQNQTYYTGAYLGSGFHEDGVVSAKNAVNKLLMDIERCSKKASILA